MRTAVRIHPEHEMGYLRLAQFLENQHRYVETLYVLKQGQQRVPDSLLMVRLEGSLYLYQSQDDKEKVETFYENIFLRYPEETVFLLDRAPVSYTHLTLPTTLQV